MTECNRKPLLFSSLGPRKIQAAFDGGHLTTDGGALLLREVDRRVGLTQALAEGMADPRDPAKTTHDLRSILVELDSTAGEKTESVVSMIEGAGFSLKSKRRSEMVSGTLWESVYNNIYERSG